MLTVVSDFFEDWDSVVKPAAASDLSNILTTRLLTATLSVAPLTDTVTGRSLASASFNAGWMTNGLTTASTLSLEVVDALAFSIDGNDDEDESPPKEGVGESRAGAALLTEDGGAEAVVVLVRLFLLALEDLLAAGFRCLDRDFDTWPVEGKSTFGVAACAS